MEAQKGHYSNAANYMEKYVADNPQDSEALETLGQLYILSNQHNKAVDAFQRALKVNPSSQDAKQALEGLNASSEDTR